MPAEYGGGNSCQSFAEHSERETTELAGFQLATEKAETLSAAWRKFPGLGESLRKIRFVRSSLFGSLLGFSVSALTVGSDFGVNLAVTKLVEAGLFGVFINRVEGGDEVSVDRGVLLLHFQGYGIA